MLHNKKGENVVTWHNWDIFKITYLFALHLILHYNTIKNCRIIHDFAFNHERDPIIKEKDTGATNRFLRRPFTLKIYLVLYYDFSPESPVSPSKSNLDYFSAQSPINTRSSDGIQNIYLDTLGRLKHRLHSKIPLPLITKNSNL